MTAPPDVAALVRAYRDEGWSLHRCAAGFRIGHPRAAALLREAGVAIRPPGRWAPPVDAAALARAYSQGWPAARCGQMYGVSARTVLAVLRAQGVPVRRPGQRRAEVDAAALARAYCGEGWTLDQCAQKFSVSRQTLATLLRGMGAEIRPACVPAGRADPAALASAYTHLGWSLKRCGQEFGISAERAAVILRDRGVRIRTRGRRPVNAMAASPAAGRRTFPSPAPSARVGSRQRQPACGE